MEFALVLHPCSTWLMDGVKNDESEKPKSRFSSTGVSNLLRHRASGILLRPDRPPRERSLEIARNYRQNSCSGICFEKRRRQSAAAKVTKGQAMTFARAAQIYAEQVPLERLAEATKEFRLRPASTFRRTWPKIWETDLRRISSDDCVAWLQRYENGASTYTPHRATSTVRGDSPTVINACIGYLRRVFDVGIKAGVIGENPSRDMKRKPLRAKLLELPWDAIGRS